MENIQGRVLHNKGKALLTQLYLIDYDAIFEVMSTNIFMRTEGQNDIGLCRFALRAMSFCPTEYGIFYWW